MERNEPGCRGQLRPRRGSGARYIARMFWNKVECDGCNQKVSKRQAGYYRGSYFCSRECCEAWAKRNPPRMAQGSVEQLKRELIALVDAALDTGRAPGVDPVARAIPVVGSVLRNHAAQDRVHSTLQAIQYTTEVLPYLNALGYHEEAYVFDTAEPGTNHHDKIVAAMLSARARAMR